MKQNLFSSTDDAIFCAEVISFTKENGMDALSRFLAKNPNQLERFLEKRLLFATRPLEEAKIFWLIASSPSPVVWSMLDFGCDHVRQKLEENQWTSKQKADALRFFAKENNEEAFHAILPFSDPLDNSGWGEATPLSCAIDVNAIGIVKTILKQITPEQIGRFPLYKAVKCQHYELVKILHRFTLPKNREGLYLLAIGQGNMDIIRFLSPNTKEEAEEEISKEWPDPSNSHSIILRRRALSVYAEKEKAEIEQETAHIQPSTHVNPIVRL